MTTPLVILAEGADDNGFACMLAGLLEQNLADRPAKQRSFHRLIGRVAIVVEDANVAVTLQFEGGSLTVHDGIVGIPDVTVRADSDDVMAMSLVELLPRVGWPDPRGEGFRKVVRASMDKRIRVHGALTNVPLLLRLTRILSVN